MKRTKFTLSRETCQEHAQREGMHDTWQEETWHGNTEQEACLQEKGKDFTEGLENKIEDLFRKVEKDTKWNVEEKLENQSKKSNIQVTAVPERG